ncbi:hypothetical protein RIF29_00815 [Crotalaria pallida]|uniref:Uncharacterized protein n=1 Tax=Crotalaria pallida TaxID=3830 RepID=A0AAN9IWN1_CROPI
MGVMAKNKKKTKGGICPIVTNGASTAHPKLELETPHFVSFPCYHFVVLQLLQKGSVVRGGLISFRLGFMQRLVQIQRLREFRLAPFLRSPLPSYCFTSLRFVCSMSYKEAFCVTHGIRLKNSAFHQFKVKNEVATLAKLGFDTIDSE